MSIGVTNASREKSDTVQKCNYEYDFSSTIQMKFKMI